MRLRRSPLRPPPGSGTPSRGIGHPVFGRWAVVVGSVVLTGSLAAPPSQASDSAQHSAARTAPATARAAEPIAMSGLGSGPHTVTLVTGDKVKLTAAGAGKFTVEPDPGIRSDGHIPSLLTEITPHGVYAIPDDARPAVAAGRLDRELFNVKYLAENGYADDAAKQLPVIVQYPADRTAASLKAAAQALPASEPAGTLKSIHASAVKVSKADADVFWSAIRATPKNAKDPSALAMGEVAGTLRGGVAKVWLDRKVKATLDVSVPMIGAPQAWAGGHDGTGVKVAILDTGIDGTHPDLTGKVVASKSFIEGEDTVDGAGHGTHVASTITGSGAGSAGRYKGVAPGAKLMIGKVLSNSGSGAESGVIEGMEWATANGADIVSMSLGSGPSDGTDPVSQTVNDLSASTGTLFVISAGNSGGTETVESPGAATSALTVAAVDKSDRLAGFSSRGPRLGDYGLKPDIAAPGVDIVAAHAAGTSMGTPVDDLYSSMSGTSMAAPHVAGAAAIIAQHHPDWDGQRIKAALMSTTKDDGYTVYEQGAGRVDVARADSQQVFATTANLDFASVTAGSPPSEQKVTYANLGDQPVTLTLTPSLRTTTGTTVEGKLRPAVTTLTVPASGTATTTVSFDPAGLGYGRYTGALAASGDGVRLTTPVGAVSEPPTVKLTVHTIGRDGRPQTPSGQSILDIGGEKGDLPAAPTVVEEGTLVTRVPVGTLSVTQLMAWRDDDDRSNSAWLINPEVTVTGDTEITLDARKAGQVRFSTPRPAQPLNNNYQVVVQRQAANGAMYGYQGGALEPVGAWEKLWALPTAPVSKGTFRFTSQWTLGQSETAMSVRTPGRSTALNVVSSLHDGTTQDGHPDWRAFSGTRDLRVVDVGLGRDEDLAGLDLKGRLVLMEADLAAGVFGPACGVRIERIGAVRDAGAAGLVVFPSADSNCTVPMPVAQEPFTGELKPLGLPNVFLSHREGLQLRARTGHAPVTVRVAATPETPYDYVLKQYAEKRIPSSLHSTYTDRQLARIDQDFHSSDPRVFDDYRYVWKTDDIIPTVTSLAYGSSAAFTGPRSRTEWVALDPAVLQEHFVHRRNADGSGSFQGQHYRTELYDKPVRTRQQWFAEPSTPGAETAAEKVYKLPHPGAIRYDQPGPYCALCIQGNQLTAVFSEVSGPGSDREGGGGFWRSGAVYTSRYDLHLYRDGKEIPRRVNPEPLLASFPSYDLPDGPATYRLTAKDERNDTAWTFAAPPGTEHVQPGFQCASWVAQGVGERCRPAPAVFVSYDLGAGLSMHNTVAAGRTHRFTVDAYHSPSAAAMPAIAGLKLWASTDDGKTFRSVPVKRNHDGTYTAATTYPAYRDTTGAVTLKAQAWDRDGNSVVQTTTRAFALRR
ncbi:S8 family serine peptidase [Streptomyces sp. NPDC050738]|uniref:S8 family peptidase n=1 Tax=Streptomyces sp. NPDC050738 TaxID=3154744 RepID=UPI0034369D3A